MSGGSASYYILAVVEAPADLRRAALLLDRIISEKVDWVGDDLDSIRQFVGLSIGERHLRWKDIRARYKRSKLPPMNRRWLRSVRKLPDATPARKALLLSKKYRPDVDFILLLRDADGQRGKREALKQARGGEGGRSPWPFTVIIGLAEQEQEAWLLNGFEPRDDGERSRLKELRKTLGFHPCRGAHKLHSKGDTKQTAKPSAKRTLDELTNGSEERKLMCITDTDIETLCKNGDTTGLREYIGEIRERVIPVISGKQNPYKK